ncbi:purple acid phosphatase [Pseudocyphellaria aurata]|nr:purple acid phosphatase [Pseudocyphellaria aurata]
MRGPMTRLQAALLMLYAAVCLQPTTGGQSPLRFRDDRFKVLQLTDLHYGGCPEDDALTDVVQQRLLDLEQPDLVVFSGDLVSGYQWNESLGPGWFSERWHQLILPVKASGVPWALTLGNHDGEADLTAEEVVQLASPISLTKQVSKTRPLRASSELEEAHPKTTA